MNTTDPFTNTDAAEAAATDPSTQPASLQDDLDFGDVQLGERQGAACSMEEDCESCQ